MNNLIIRIVIIVLAVFGVYKMFPQISGPINYYLNQPKFQSDVVIPAVHIANKVLPDKLQIPMPAQVMGDSVDLPSDSPLKSMSDQISRQAASVAGEQIDQLKKSAGDAFCSALIEKIKSECGVDQAP